MDNYTTAYAVHVEGARIGLVTCTKCGATLILDRDSDVLAVHNAWHDQFMARNHHEE